jgi:integrase
MSRIRLRYVDHFTDRHGTVRYYFRRPGGKRTPLPGIPGSDAFMAAYAAAEASGPASPEKRERGEPGTFDRLLGTYFESTDYAELKASTKRAYRLAMERLIRLETLGPRKVKDIDRNVIKRIMAKRADRPAASNDALKKLRILIKFAIDMGWRKDDPTLHLKKMKGGEHHTWTDEEIAAFEACWPLGSVQRTAFALLLFTGQRVSDVARMSWRDVSPDGLSIHVTQDKTEEKLWLALLDDLQAALRAWPKHERAILCTGYGKPFTVKGLGNKMADAFDAAGLDERCVTHGLRKAAARRLAEAGCSANEIAAVTGHRTLAEVQRYTKGADQRRLNRAATDRLELRGAVPTRGSEFGDGEEKIQ